MEQRVSGAREGVAEGGLRVSGAGVRLSGARVCGEERGGERSRWWVQERVGAAAGERSTVDGAEGERRR